MLPSLAHPVRLGASRNTCLGDRHRLPYDDRGNSHQQASARDSFDFRKSHTFTKVYIQGFYVFRR